MIKFDFWNLWSKINKALYLILLLFFIVAAVIYTYAVFEGPEAAIQWEIVNYWEKFGVIIERFQVALFDFDVYADNYVISESFSAGPITINDTAVKGYLLFIALGISILLAVVSLLPRFWYIAAMAFFIFLVISFKLEQLQLFGRSDLTGVVFVFLMYIPASYYIHAIRTDIRFFYRVLLFIFITVLVAIVIGYFSLTPNTWLYLANFGLAGPVILSLIFILMVSHEIIVAFLFLITNYNTSYSKNSLLHFSALSVIYLLNVLFAYLHSRGAMEWDIIYINAFILLIVSSILGIWGFRKRSELFENMIPMNGPGEMLYISLGIICFSTVGYLSFTANDPILETFEDAIIFSHFGFGTFFFIYVLVNFMTLLAENMRVFKVVYKPVRMPYYMANIGGLAIVVLFLFRANLYPYSQAVSGYFNGIGDIYSEENNLFLAEQYYRLGSGYGFQNHKSNYSLASLAVKQNDQAAGLYYFKEAVSKHPTDYAYANLANIYKNNDRIFDAAFTLKEGIGIFPDSGPLKNNLALLYSRLNMIDSSLIVLESALRDEQSKNAAQTNALSIYAKAGKTNRPDSISSFFENTDHIPAWANKLIILNQERIPSTENFDVTVFEDSVLGLNKFSYLNNSVFNSIYAHDSSLTKLLSSLQLHPANISFQENLVFLQAMDAYYHNKIAAGFKYMDNLQANSDASGYYNYILGAWSMQQGAPLLASKYYSTAEEKGIEEATLLKGVALSMAEKPDRAREHWSSLLYDEDENLVNVATNMLRAINLDRDLTLPEENEEFIYRLLLFNYPQISQPEVLDLLTQLHDIQLKESALVLIVEYNLNKENIHTTEFYLEELKNLKVPDAENKILWLETRIAAVKNDLDKLKANVSKLKPSTSHQENLYHYFQAKINENDKQYDEAANLYKKVGYQNPFFEKGTIAAADYFAKQNDPILSYDILREAVEINTTSSSLHKAYILAALEIGLNIYAESALEDLRKLESKSEYNKFYVNYKSKLEELKQKNSDWN